jgi:hypothetical protein
MHHRQRRAVFARSPWKRCGCTKIQTFDSRGMGGHDAHLLARSRDKYVKNWAVGGEADVFSSANSW